MLLSLMLLLGLLGLVAAEPAVYFKEQFLDGGNAWSRLEADGYAGSTPSAAPLQSWPVSCNYHSEGQHQGL